MLEETAIPLASGTKEIALAPRLLVLTARRARKRPCLSSASSASEVKSRPWKSLAKASRRSHDHLTGRPIRLAAQATGANSGQVLLRMPKMPPTSPETTRTAAAGRGINRVARRGLIMDANSRPQLHRHAGHPVDRRFQSHNMRGLREGKLG